MDEFEIITRFFSRAPSDGSVIAGIGDDGALLEPPAGKLLVDVVDTIVEGVHFPAGFPPRDIGYRAVAVNLSDIAAMGATPRWMTLALTLPQAMEDWLQEFAAGLFEAAGEFGVQLVGGDTTRGATTVVSVQMLGEVQEGRALYRSGAGVGDMVYVSGTIGDAAAGLKLLEGRAGETRAQVALARSFARPVARVSLGRALAGVATAAIDLSDGLLDDLGKLVQASGCSALIDVQALPLSAEIRELFDHRQARRLALGGGDDYELCFTVPAEREADVTAIGEKLGVSLTQIGSIAAGSGVTCLDDGKEVAIDAAGYRHFGNSHE